MRSLLINLLEKIISRIINRINIKMKEERRERLYSSFKKIGENYDIVEPYRIINPKYISIGENFSCLYNLRLEAIDKYANGSYFPEIIIGNNVSINSDCHIGCINKVFIGNNVLIASKVYISDHSHGEVNSNALKMPPRLRQLISKGPVIIEDNVWLGENVCILSGVKVGENSIVGANSVVTRDVPANCVVAGIPARVIKDLSS